MQDRDLVSAIVAGEQAGLAAVYDRYAPALHAYCRVLLPEPADAASAVADTFVIAAARLGDLREPGQLRPWLYAVARNECLRRLRPRAPAAPLDVVDEWAADESEPYDDLEVAQLRGLVVGALAGLSRGDREILELNLRHGLDSDDLGWVLGVSRSRAQALATQACAQFERSLQAVLVARTGQDACWQLASLLDGWNGQLTELSRKRVARHIRHCRVCGEQQLPDLGPALLLNLLPAVLLPPDLRNQVLHLLADDSLAALRHRGRVVRRAGRFQRSGFPRPLGSTAGGHGARDQVLGAAGMLVFLGVLGVGTVFGLAALDHHPHPPVSALAIGPQPREAPSSSLPASSGHSSRAAAAPGATSLVPTPTESASATASATPSASPSASPSRSASASPSPSAPASPSPSGTPLPSTTPPGAAVPAPTTVVLTQGADGTYSGSFTVTATGGPVDFTVSNPAAGNLSVSPSEGSLTAGEQVTVTVTVVSDAGLGLDTPLTVGPGGATVDVQYPPAGSTGGPTSAPPQASPVALRYVLAAGRW
ncbi:MAG TPA: sigma-70 family RNA polymerase sigma factor [Streptosporangiaceae bacterium]